ncbi:MAG: Phosphoribosylformimino-5-aminoimidazole carboxamide ribonucleotide (ProFAR) isomerase [Chloroflexi bacterium AL-W]|nr:Phosphoribosylformimino-5-aminoimidazole carboxamide ribonucleotide (ProFAR) isomerase [Chloroflexi bacterium AL-N1]NOK70233.1 Phosphoribosylformimino-5-aminoimidazole carboxamide ribonucleotide (ProFAR) isomerase [Chloroflexi bacterium AL-N10]NOK77770.1 Phosphoribosylformimino-5-aminoimidazole carboxamide ribonucleotide (ProFAR) isomerase [Chloroflexi bacterium AL-N5]NOK84779.1 Phosphoribosylformimino-5-aminoimidazole carboxamide ribonucleotide (ProFAR) isomerase [Chloroflexi bacterium AL-W]
MEIIPAIDIQNGQCVRLYQGDFERSTVYGTDPSAVAQRWVAQGAQRLHVVDLDGAKAGCPINTQAIQAIVDAVNVPVQLGGGLRTDDAVQAALGLGVSRVILGTAAVQHAETVAGLVQRYGESIIVGVDARDGFVATAGWMTTAHVRAEDLVAEMVQVGVQRIIYTDISRDGTLTEPNYDATAALITADGPAIIASGGVSRVEQLQRLAQLGAEAAIVGRALYTGDIDLSYAIEALQ